MELIAALRALSEFTTPEVVEVRSDSEYLIKGMNEWIARWWQARRAASAA